VSNVCAARIEAFTHLPKASVAKNDHQKRRFTQTGDDKKLKVRINIEAGMCSSNGCVVEFLESIAQLISRNAEQFRGARLIAVAPL
jgi:hypothetical protein